MKTKKTINSNLTKLRWTHLGENLQQTHQLSPWEKYPSVSHARNITESPPNFIYFKKEKEILDKTSKGREFGLATKIWVQELNMRGEDISTIHIHCTQQDPSI